MNFMKTIHALSLSKKARLLVLIIRNGESAKFMVLVDRMNGMQNMRSLLHMIDLVKYSVLNIYMSKRSGFNTNAYKCSPDETTVR